MKNTKKYIPCVLTTIVLVFSVIGLLLIVLFKSYILSGNAMYDTLNKKDIYSKVYNAIDTYFSEQYNTTGIPKEVYMDAITQEEVTELTNQTTAEGIAYINNTSFTPSYDYSALDLSIDKFFEDYATSIDYTKDDVSTMSAYDQTINDKFIEAVNGYCYDGTSKDDALAAFKSAVKDNIAGLTVE